MLDTTSVDQSCCCSKCRQVAWDGPPKGSLWSHAPREPVRRLCPSSTGPLEPPAGSHSERHSRLVKAMPSVGLLVCPTCGSTAALIVQRTREQQRPQLGGDEATRWWLLVHGALISCCLL